jgi:hypothetical protein
MMKTTCILPYSGAFVASAFPCLHGTELISFEHFVGRMNDHHVLNFVNVKDTLQGNECDWLRFIQAKRLISY